MPCALFDRSGYWPGVRGHALEPQTMVDPGQSLHPCLALEAVPDPLPPGEPEHTRTPRGTRSQRTPQGNPPAHRRSPTPFSGAVAVPWLSALLLLTGGVPILQRSCRVFYKSQTSWCRTQGHKREGSEISYWGQLLGAPGAGRRMSGLLLVEGGWKSPSWAVGHLRLARPQGRWMGGSACYLHEVGADQEGVRPGEEGSPDCGSNSLWHPPIPSPRGTRLSEEATSWESSSVESSFPCVVRGQVLGQRLQWDSAGAAPPWGLRSPRDHRADHQVTSGGHFQDTHWSRARVVQVAGRSGISGTGWWPQPCSHIDVAGFPGSEPPGQDSICPWQWG